MLETVTRGLRPLLARHLSQPGSVHWTTFFFGLVEGGRWEALLEPCECWASLAPLSMVVRRLLVGPGAATSSTKAWVCEAMFAAAFALILATESALAVVAWVRLEYPESEATSACCCCWGAEFMSSRPDECEERLSATLACLRLSATSSSACES